MHHYISSYRVGLLCTHNDIMIWLYAFICRCVYMICMHTICVHMRKYKYQVLNFADIHVILESPAFHTKHMPWHHLLLHVQSSGIATHFPSLFGLRSEHEVPCAKTWEWGAKLRTFEIGTEHQLLVHALTFTQ